MSANANDTYKKIATLTREMSEHLPDSSVNALDELVGEAVQHIPVANYIGVTVVERRENVVNLVSTHEYPRTLDTIQQKLGDGPCFAAAAKPDTYYIPDLRTEERWPSFCALALEHTPVQSIASFQLFTTRTTAGALNLYADTADAFDEQSLDLGCVLAAHAAIVWGAVQRNERFRAAFSRRDTIGQAKGVLMERYDLDAAHAFELLRTLSQDCNVRLHEVARKLIDVDHPPIPLGTDAG